MNPGTVIGTARLSVSRWPNPHDPMPRVRPTEVPNMPERVPSPTRELPVEPKEIPGPPPMEVPEPEEEVVREG